MSPRLAISVAISVLMMAAFVLSVTGPAAQPFGEGRESARIQAEVLSPVRGLGALVPQSLR